MSAPGYEELADALRCLALAYGGRHVRDGLRMIGLSQDSTHYIRGKPYKVSVAYETLASLEDALGEKDRANTFRNKRGEW